MEPVTDRKRLFVDLAMLLAAVCQAMTTWLFLCDRPGVLVWRALFGVGVTVLLVLAALTRNQNWAAAIRAVTAGWLIAAPCLLGFGEIAPALWTHLAIGALVMTLAIPALAVRQGGSHVRIAT